MLTTAGRRIRKPHSEKANRIHMPQTQVPTDSQLLVTIARDRDREAFTEFYTRFEKSCFSLAYRILGDHPKAQEAVQEAMLQVWQSAPAFDEGGHARGWVHRILVRKCLRTLRKKKETPSEEDMAQQAAAPHDGPAAHLAEKTEVHGELNRLLDELPALERRILALYYGGELSQDEIGQALQMPQSSISHRLKLTLNGLRSKLSAAGFASLEETAAAALIVEALQTHMHTDVPLGMRSAVLDALQREHPPLKASANIPGKMFMLMGSIALMGIGVSLYQGSSPDPQEANPADQPSSLLTPANETNALAPNRRTRPYNLKWSFARRQGPKFETIEKNPQWSWEPKGIQGEGVMRAAKPGIQIVLPNDLPFPPGPLKVTVQIDSAPEAGSWSVGAFRVERDGQDFISAPATIWAPNKKMNYHPHKARIMEIFIFENHEVNLLDGKVRIIRQYETPFPGGLITLFFQNVRIHSISVSSIEMDQLSENLQPDALERLTKKRKQKQEKLRLSRPSVRLP